MVFTLPTKKINKYCLILLFSIHYVNYRSGNVYEGEWKSCHRHGNGTMYWNDRREKYSGEWRNGVQVKTYLLKYHTQPIIILSLCFIV